MRKRSIFLVVATALTLVLLTAGLAFANGRWDSYQRSGQAVTGQVANGPVQAQAQQPTSSVRSEHGRHGVVTTHYTTCADPTGDYRSRDVRGSWCPAASTATGRQPSSCPARERDRDHRQAGHDGRCGDGWH
jgi:hypothetical protein